jgi:hypothetical protein
MAPDLAPILRRFEAPDEVRDFPKGRFELVRLGRHDDRPRHLSARLALVGRCRSRRRRDELSCRACRLVLSGCAAAAMDDGTIHEMRAGDLFHIPPGHDSWVVGDEPYVSLHFLGAEDYAAKEASGGDE